jgi:hypothetical protein
LQVFLKAADNPHALVASDGSDEARHGGSKPLETTAITVGASPHSRVAPAPGSSPTASNGSAIPAPRHHLVASPLAEAKANPPTAAAPVGDDGLQMVANPAVKTTAAGGHLSTKSGKGLDALRSQARVELGGCAGFITHFRALFLKRLNFARRDCRTLVYQVRAAVGRRGGGGDCGVAVHAHPTPHHLRRFVRAAGAAHRAGDCRSGPAEGDRSARVPQVRPMRRGVPPAFPPSWR